MLRDRFAKARSEHFAGAQSNTSKTAKANECEAIFATSGPALPRVKCIHGPDPPWETKIGFVNGRILPRVMQAFLLSMMTILV